jgi:hypothetical protein
MHVDEVNKVDVRPGPGWSVVHNMLYRLPPELASSVEGLPKGFTAWNLYFLEDLLHVVNPEKGRILDVGWFPDSDPSGSFRLVLIKYWPATRFDDAVCLWDEPIVDISTRSVETLVAEINKLLQ